ncbi:MAG: hypothetical protein AAGF26_07580 [Cyanobacteria bacterium P01_G01_bin.49]
MGQDDYQALSNLGKSGASLTPNHQTNPLLMARANNLAAKFVYLAQIEKQSIRREGDSYILSVDPNGGVEISARDGRGVIYHQTIEGNQPLATNLMTEKDLSFFERQFGSSQPQSLSPVYTATRSGRRR